MGVEAVLRDAIHVTGKGDKERIVLFGAPAARALELYPRRGQPWNKDPVWRWTLSG